MTEQVPDAATFRMGWLDRFFCWCAQVDPQVVLKCEQLALISAAHVGMGVLGVTVINGALVAYSVSNIPGIGGLFPVAAGVLVSIAVFLIDRSMVGSLINTPMDFQKRAWRNPEAYVGVIIRVIVSLAMAQCVAYLFVLAFSRGSIEGELGRWEKQQNAALYERRDDALKSAENERARLTVQINSKSEDEKNLKTQESKLIAEISSLGKARVAALAAAEIEAGGEVNTAGLEQLESFEFSARRGDGTRTQSFRAVAELHAAEIVVAQGALAQVRAQLERAANDRVRLEGQRAKLPGLTEIDKEYLVDSEMVVAGRDLIALAQGYELLKDNPTLGKGAQVVELRLHVFLVMLDAGLILLTGFMRVKTRYALEIHANLLRAATAFRREFSARNAQNGDRSTSRFEYAVNPSGEESPVGPEGKLQ